MSRLLGCSFPHYPHYPLPCILSPFPFFPPYKSFQKTLKSFLLTNQLNHHHPHYFSSHSSPDILSESTCLNLLSHCNSKSLKPGICLHTPIIKLALNTHLYITNNLLSLYSKCSEIDNARKLFDETPIRDVVSWTGMISALVQTGNDEEAMELFQEMLISGAIPNQFTFSSVVRCASSLREFDLGTRAHAQIIKSGFELNPVLATALLDFYSKCYEVEEASKIFELMHSRDTVSWTTMISALVEAGDWHRAVQLYVSMIGSGVCPNTFTFAKLLIACVFLGLRFGQLVHAHAIVLGINLNLILKTALVDMYCKCRRASDAWTVLRQTSEADVMLWTAMVSGNSQAGDYEEAVAAFRAMESAGIVPNSFTYAAVLGACTSAPMLELGMEIHSRVIKAGIESDVSVGNALIDLYAKLSPDSKDPVHAFEAIHYPNVVSWTALIASFAQHEQLREVFAAFTEMRARGVEPNSFTLSTILKGCGSSEEALVHAMKIHTFVLKTNSDALDETFVVGNSLVDVYARLGRAEDAWTVANTMMPSRDVFAYTSLAKGLNQMGLHRKALDLIAHIMLNDNVRLDDFSLATFLSASAGLVAIEPGRQLHCYSIKSGLNGCISVSNGLVDMYSKCGSIEEARKAFSMIAEPNVVSWNGLISGLASNGHFSEALSAFEDMRLHGMKPDGITMLVVLYACSHGGLVDLGIDYFNSMKEKYDVTPEEDHYVCLIDLLGRAGRLEEAACAIETMDLEPKDPLIYKTLLSCCKIHGNLVMGECMARRALEMDPSDSAVYVMLAGIYDNAGKLELGEQTRKMMRERRVSKFPGQSWMESRNLFAGYG